MVTFKLQKLNYYLYAKLSHKRSPNEYTFHRIIPSAYKFMVSAEATWLIVGEIS